MSDRLEDLRTALTGRYDIDRQIGQGGMATVYLARDVKHNRQVAVKVLRPDLAAALGHERFLREIEIAANLTHPHILPLYDSGEAGGFLYYVMPYIEGDTLRDRIEKEGELPVTEAVRIVREVTDALAFAHSQGVVHRDIKPDNVMLSGRHAMVTDFGVAKAVSEATGRNQLTTAGVALGTPAYMAPEQATADPHVDHRADIYALGALAYELLAGRTPFIGKTPQAVLAAHVTEQVEPVSKHRDQVSAELESVVMRCLAKKPADRWQSADEMLPHLETMTTSSGGLTPTSTRPIAAVTVGRRRRVWWMVLGAVATMVIIGVFGASMMTDEPIRVTVANVRQITHSPMLELFPDISDDGREVVYNARQGEEYHVHIRSADGGPDMGLTEDRPGSQLYPEWSPSGGEVRFLDMLPGGAFSWQQISKFGGQATPAPSTALTASGSLELHALGNGIDSIVLRDVVTGDERLLGGLPDDMHSVTLAPDGSRIAYVQYNSLYYAPGTVGNDVPSAIWIARLDDWAQMRITPGTQIDIHPVWLDNDRLLFVSNRDGQRDIYLVVLRPSGEPVNEPIRVTTGANVHTLSATPDGSRAVYSALRFRSNLHEIILPEQGSVSLGAARPLTRENASIEGHDRSSDGKWLAYDSNIQGQQDIYVMPADGGESRRVTTDPGRDFSPMFSPDGSELVFYSHRHGSRDIYLIRIDGSGEQQLTGREVDGWEIDDQEWFPAFSPDGMHISFGTNGKGLMVMSREVVGGPWGQPEALTDSVGVDESWAPDSRRLVYVDGAGGLTVVTLAGEKRRLVDPVDGIVTGPQWPVWAADDRIFFRATGADGTRGIFMIEGLGSEPRMVVRFDDPQLVSDAFGMTVVGNSLILTMEEKESDIYVMELEY